MTPTEAMERTRAVIRRQHKTLATEHTYLHWLRHYMVALGGMPRTLISEQKLEHFLTELALQKNVSAATQNQAFNAKRCQSRHGRKVVRAFSGGRKGEPAKVAIAQPCTLRLR